MAKRTPRREWFIFQIRIELLRVKGPVWRRVLVRSQSTLHELHLVLNEAMGWNNSHLHLFLFKDRKFADPSADEGTDFEDERAVWVDDLFTVGDRFRYDYDFGDGWEHDVKIEKKLPDTTRMAFPVCVGGARACPPEDCRGPYGYEQLLKELKSGKKTEFVSWIGGFFDPKGFDANRVNYALSELDLRR